MYIDKQESKMNNETEGSRVSIDYERIRIARAIQKEAIKMMNEDLFSKEQKKETILDMNNKMKTKEECIKWCKSFLDGSFGTRPNTEDCNFFKSIIGFLEQTMEIPQDEPSLCIPKLKMPGGCDDCVCGWDGYCSALTLIDNHIMSLPSPYDYSSTERYPRCPLIEIKSQKTEKEGT